MARKQIINRLVGFGRRSIGPHANRIGGSTYRKASGRGRTTGFRVPEMDWDTVSQSTVDSWNWTDLISATIISVEQFLTEVPNADRPPMDNKNVLKVVTTANNTGTFVDIDLAAAANMLEGNTGCWVILPDSEPEMHSNDFRVLLDDSIAPITFRQGGVDPSPNTHYRDAWVWLGANATYKYSDSSTDMSHVVRIRPIIRPNGQSITVYLSPFKYDIKHRTVFVLEQDDGQIDTNLFFEDLDAENLKGGVNLIPSSLTAPGKPDVDFYKGIIADGHAVCSHGVSNSGIYAGPSSQNNWVASYEVEGDATMRAAIQHEVDTLDSLGLGNNRYHHALPEGAQNAEVLDALRDIGMLSVRHTGGSSNDGEGVYWEDGSIAGGNYMQCKALNVESVINTNDAVDAAISNQLTMQRIYWHQYADTFRAESQALMAYIAGLRDAGECQVMTFPEFFSLSKMGRLAA